MKLAISVPDDLWFQAVATSRVGPSPSAVVQAALRQAVGPSPTVSLDDETKRLFEAARQKLAASAQETFQWGYRAGLRLADAIGDWNAVRTIVDQGLVAFLEREHQRLLALRTGGGAEFQNLRSHFVVDERRGETSSIEAGDDDEGEWFVNHDPDALWLQYFTVTANGDVVGGSPSEAHPLLVRGTEAALRDLLDHATP